MPRRVFRQLLFLLFVVITFSKVGYGKLIECMPGDKCDDGNACTRDTCDSNGQCRHTPIANCQSSNYADHCTGDWFSGDPHPLAILCPIARFLNVLVLSVGAMFLIFVFLSALKFAMSQGDPKAMQGAKQSLTLAIIGMLVVIGVFAILTIMGNILGIKSALINSPFDALSTGLADLLHKLNIW